MIEKIENLDNMNLIELHLQGNAIKNITGLNKLKKLRTLNLSRNQISKFILFIILIIYFNKNEHS